MQYLSRDKQELFCAIVKHLLEMSLDELRAVLIYIWTLKLERKGGK